MQVNDVTERLATLEAALAFYADPDSYDCGCGDVIITDYPVMADRGDLAREVLSSKGETG